MCFFWMGFGDVFLSAFGGLGLVYRFLGFRLGEALICSSRLSKLIGVFDALPNLMHTKHPNIPTLNLKHQTPKPPKPL